MQQRKNYSQSQNEGILWKSSNNKLILFYEPVQYYDKSKNFRIDSIVAHSICIIFSQMDGNSSLSHRRNLTSLRVPTVREVIPE